MSQTAPQLWIGITDKRWFESLAALQPDEVNFWQPSGTRTFRVLQPGELFLFKLHAPDNFIVGGGHFVSYSPLPVSVAWSAFGEKNGVADELDFRKRIEFYRGRNRQAAMLDPIIGCNVLCEPFFLDRADWIPAPEDWAPNIVSGKSYRTTEKHGAELLLRLQAALASRGFVREESQIERESAYGAAYLTRGRLGQGSFRVLVTEAYGRRCAISGEKTLPVLEAAHIRPFASAGPHRIQNGLLLRSDMHKLFDLGYLTVTPELKVEVSRRLREEWQNGREYYAFHGRGLAAVPADSQRLPSREFLEWHNQRVFRN